MQKLAHYCTFVHICVQFQLIFVNFVYVNGEILNNLLTFAADFSKKMFKDMKKINAMLVGAMLTVATTATAGGILTNTNQSIDFLRNPARDAAIGLDGVYSNPAGVAFLPEGFHLGINWQYAHQTRTIQSTNPVFALGKKNNGTTTKTFEGVADAPFIPLFRLHIIKVTGVSSSTSLSLEVVALVSLPTVLVRSRAW